MEAEHVVGWWVVCGRIGRVQRCVSGGSSAASEVYKGQGYASSIKFVHPLNCAEPWPCDGSVIVRQAFRHLKKLYGLASKGAKFPICLETLRAILPLLEGWPVPALMSHDDRMFACASLIATCTFLRGGEFTTNTQSSREVLLTRDVNIVTFNGRRNVTTSIPRPKNAWWCASVDARCFNPGEAGMFSPVLWLEFYRDYSTVVLADNEAAFQTAEGAALSRDFMVQRSNELFARASWACWPTDYGSRSLALNRVGSIRCLLREGSRVCSSADVECLKCVFV